MSFSYNVETDPNHLKPLAKDILDQAAFFRMENGRITWPGFEQDVAIFERLFQTINNCNYMDDAQFLRVFENQIIPLLETSPLCTALNSPNIQVTSGHNGSTPYAHTLNVVRSLDTTPIKGDVWKTLSLRLAAIYHDAGKSLSAGISEEDIKQLMAKHNHTRHSHPDHAHTSLMMFQELLSHSKLNASLPQEVWQQIVFMVRNHHTFQDIKRHTLTVKELVQILIDELPSRWVLPLVFLLSRADVGSNPEYHQYWEDTMDIFAAAWLQLLFESDDSALPDYVLSPEVEQVIFDSLELGIPT